MDNVIVKLENVSKKFKKANIIKDLDLNIYEGEFLTLLGPSGCGKTTILRMISGLETVTTGKVYIEDEDVTNLDPTKRQVNTIFQNFALFPHKTVWDNVAFGLQMKKEEKSEIEKKVKKAIDLVNLKGFETRYPRQLSGGQQQRVAIARGIVTSPKVLLLDESLCSLDLKLKRKMQIELKKIQKKLGITFVYVTHDQNEAITMSDRIAIINKGVIEQMGTPQEVYSKPVSSFAADFIGESNIFDAVIKSINTKKTVASILDGKVLLNIAYDESLKINNEVKLMIRPENITVSKNQIKDSIEGVVEDIVYMGDYSKLFVSIGDLIFKADINDFDLYKENEKVYIRLESEHLVVIKEEKNEK